MTKTTTLQKFNADLSRRRALATACDKNPAYLYLVGKGFKRASTDLAKCIERESERIWRRVPKETLRPDVWEIDDVHHDDVGRDGAQAIEVKRAKERNNYTR